ncbi:glutamate decarboxylase [Baekduia sp.]|jgi:glutamate decarboxylase|uniref:glutamate decarboxylase n=1 Tax=Baekduia sp. TaxID=2600305 RepID=UPI002DFABFB3|nr:glutamate decarboxylase [Baekduia sp.]
MPLHHASPAPHDEDAGLAIRPQFAPAGAPATVPKLRLGDRELSPEAAYQVVHDELLLDGRSRLNLATFVTTWMEPQARVLIDECLDKNMIDKDEYPQTAELERRCVAMLAALWGAEEANGDATGCSTTGSSEACMLGGLALKWRWRERRRTAGLATDRPNLVMGANVQVCWEKFCRYWDVEPRLVPVSADATHLTPEGAVAQCDENTIGVVAILGSTFDGSYEPVAEIAAALDALQAETGLDVPLHVDAASGGFIAPFLDPELVWDFRLARVQSINASGHKYGLVYPGVGWAIWRDKAALPQDLIFDVDYLGGRMPTFALNFSRGGAQVAAQYYNLIRLGHEGYRRVQQASRDTALWLSGEIAKVGDYRLISDGGELPVFAFALASEDEGFSVYDVSEKLRARGWIVPAYPMPPGIEELAVLRVCVRNGFSRDLASIFLADLQHATAHLRHRADGPPPDEVRASFHH